MASWYGIESQIKEARQGNRQDKGVGGTDLAIDEATSKGMEANVILGCGNRAQRNTMDKRKGAGMKAPDVRIKGEEGRRVGRRALGDTLYAEMGDEGEEWAEG
jgi:hypothetical protein